MHYGTKSIRTSHVNYVGLMIKITKNMNNSSLVYETGRPT